MMSCEKMNSESPQIQMGSDRLILMLHSVHRTVFAVPSLEERRDAVRSVYDVHCSS